jgi:hypothetical protein
MAFGKYSNMCYVKPYICEYHKYYYRIDEVVKPQYREMFSNKLPFNVGNILKEEWRCKHPEEYIYIIDDSTVTVDF